MALRAGLRALQQDGETEYIVEGSRTFKDRWILKLEGVDDRNAAEALNGVELYGEVDDAEDMLEADEWYPKDLIGLEARLVEGNGLGLPPAKCRQSGGCDRLPRPIPAQDSFDRAGGNRPEFQGRGCGRKDRVGPVRGGLVPDIDLEEQYLTLDPPGGLIPGCGMI